MYSASIDYLKLFLKLYSAGSQGRGWNTYTPGSVKNVAGDKGAILSSIRKSPCVTRNTYSKNVLIQLTCHQHLN